MNNQTHRASKARGLTVLALATAVTVASFVPAWADAVGSEITATPSSTSAAATSSTTTTSTTLPSPPVVRALAPASVPYVAAAPVTAGRPAGTGTGLGRLRRSAETRRQRRQRPGTAAMHGAGTGAAIEFAKAQVGKPYQYGATGPNSYDCSGLTMRAWEAAGRSIPRTSSDQAAGLTAVPMGERQPGDILWRPGHVALYVGNDQVIAAPQTGELVSYKSAGNYQKALRP